MSKRQKRLLKLRQNPRNVSFEELSQVLGDFGFWLDRTVGSHHTFRTEFDNKVWKVTIPFRRPIKIIYVKQVLEAIDEILKLVAPEEPADDDDEN